MLAPFRASADQATRGSRFSSRSASGRLMMGSEGWGGNNLNRALAAHQRQERGTLRTHPTRRPREDIFLPEQNSLSACRSSWPVQATEGTAALSFSIAAGVKLLPHDSCWHPFALRLIRPHGALASLRGRRQAAS